MNTIANIITNLDPAAKTPALRAVVHSSMSKCIGLIRQDLRNQTRSRYAPEPTLDERNELDNASNYSAEAMGFDTKIPPIRRAAAAHAVYQWALDELNTMSVSKWNQPLTLDGMLDYMVSASKALDPVMAAAMAEAMEVDTQTVSELAELTDRQDREQLIAALPTIRLTFNNFDSSLDDEPISKMGVLDQHQLGVKVAQGLVKARAKALLSMVRTRRMSELGDLALIKEGVNKMTAWVVEFESKHAADIHEALDRGVTVNTL